MSYFEQKFACIFFSFYKYRPTTAFKITTTISGGVAEIKYTLIYKVIRLNTKTFLTLESCKN